MQRDAREHTKQEPRAGWTWVFKNATFCRVPPLCCAYILAPFLVVGMYYLNVSDTKGVPLLNLMEEFSTLQISDWSCQENESRFQLNTN